MLHQAQIDDEVLLPIADDTEEAPWMVMSMAQWRAVDALYDALHVHGRQQEPPWLVAGMLPVRYRPNRSLPDIETLAPDILVALVPNPNRLRTSYDVEREGAPPAFVLEVVSPESKNRDLDVKPRRYERMGVQEYVLFDPTYDYAVQRHEEETAEERLSPSGQQPRLRHRERPPLLDPPLRGYRRKAGSGLFERWEPDEAGRLRSDALDLWLVRQGPELRAQRPDGTLLLTHEEAEAARQAAVAEIARLRAELERRRAT